MQVVDPSDPSPWDEDDNEIPIGTQPIHYSLSVASSPYASPVKLLRPASVAPANPSAAQVTPSKSKPPKMLSAPSTLRGKKRSVSGLGSPSKRPSPYPPRSRQPTYGGNTTVPPSPLARGRTTSAAELFSHMPMGRNVSSASFLAPGNQQDRNVSASTVMSASTAFEVATPHGTPFQGQEFATLPPQPLPELLSSQHSPPLSQGRSPVCTTPQPGTVFYTSPPTSSTSFEPHGQDASLMSGVSHVMRTSRAGSMPNSTSMSSVASFPSSQGMYRQHTLGTIAEAPDAPREASVAYPIPQHPQGVIGQPTFMPMEYPAVPGMSFAQALPSGTNPVDVAAWSAQTAQTYNVHPAYYHQHQHVPNGQYAYPMHHDGRIVSQPVYGVPLHASHGHGQGMSRMTSMPVSLATGGLFAPAPQGDSYYMGRRPSDQGGSETDVLSAAAPETPRKRKAYPRIGNHLRPGPKPKSITPSKRDSASIEVQSPGSNNNYSTNLLSMPEGSGIIDFSQEQGVAGQGHEMLRTLSGVSSLNHSQPQLYIQPPAGSDDSQVGGLSKTQLEQLYTVYMSTEGSSTGHPVKRFKCQYGDCDRTFPRKSAIHSHIQTHLEDKPYKCEVEGW